MLFASAANVRRIVAVRSAAKQLGLFSDIEEPGEAPGLAVRESARSAANKMIASATRRMNEDC